MTDDPSGAATAAPDEPGLPRDGALRPLFQSVGLIFVAIPLVGILTSGADTLSIVAAIAGAILFLAVIGLTTRVPAPGTEVRPGTGSRTPAETRQLVATTIAVVLLIGIAVFESLHQPGTGWFAFFYFASTAASTIRSSRIALALMLASGVATALTFYAVDPDVSGAFIQGLSVTVIGFTVYSAIAVRRTNRALVAARHELARLAVAEERTRIARDLHDTLGHSLSVIALKSELAGRLIDDDPARARSEIEDVQQVARDSLSAVRETIGGYRQPSLATELAGARSALAAAGIAGRVEPAPEDLPQAADAVLSWAVREGVTNILRHGHAAAAEILVRTSPSSAAVEILNDRRAGADGAQPATAAQPDADWSDATAGTGLAGLRDRVAAVGGSVEAGRLPDGGFRLHVQVPTG